MLPKRVRLFNWYDMESDGHIELKGQEDLEVNKMLVYEDLYVFMGTAAVA